MIGPEKRLKNLRKAKGYSQRELADKVGIQAATLSRYENHIRDASCYVLSKLTKALDTNSDYLLGNTDYPYPIDTLVQTTKLTYDQMDLLDKYLSINENEKKLVKERAQAYYDKNQLKE